MVGVIFSIILVNIQGGLYLGLVNKAGLLVDYGKADIWIGHYKMHNVDFPGLIPRRWINRIKSIKGVEEAQPYIVGHTQMTLPGGGFEPVFIVGVDTNSLLGSAWNIVEGSDEDILKPDGIIVDRLEDYKLDNPKVGSVREIGGHRARIVAKSEGIQGFLVNPYVFTTYNRAVKFLNIDQYQSSYFLVRVKDKNKIDEVCNRIKSRLPQLSVYTKEEYSAISVNYWMTRTGLGISFGAATLLGIFVGLIIVAQTLHNIVLDRLIEFGTLKAIGISNIQLFLILTIYATIMAVAGSFIGMNIVLFIQMFFSTPKAPILIPLWLSFGSTFLVFMVCIVSTIIPYLRIKQVDPFIVMQG